MTRITRAFLLAPWAVVPVIFATILLLTRQEPVVGVLDAVFITLIFSILAVPLAYAEVLFFGTPYYSFLKKRNRLTLRYILPMAALLGAATGALFTSSHDTPLQQYVEAAYFAFCGVSVACVIWYLGLREA
jgi:hypothetical protein